MSDKNPKTDPRFTASPRIYYLYVKIHNKTGMRYLGRTAQKKPSVYLGSGTYWLRHLKKYGNDHRTIIIGRYFDLASLRGAGLYYSKLWDVVASDKWANLCLEDGNNETQGWSHLTSEMRSANGKKGGAKGGKIMGPKTVKLKIGLHGLDGQQRLANASKAGKISAAKRKNDPNYIEQRREWMLVNNPFRGKKHSEKTREKMRLAKRRRKDESGSQVSTSTGPPSVAVVGS